MFGLLHALESVATLLLMCDRRDLGTAIGERPPNPNSENDTALAMRTEDAISSNVHEFFEPNLYLYDAYPGGIGFSEPLFRAHNLLMEKTRELISSCECEEGRPSCVGPAGDLALGAKEATLAIPTPGILYRYQNTRVTEFDCWKSLKTKGRKKRVKFEVIRK